MIIKEWWRANVNGVILILVLFILQFIVIECALISLGKKRLLTVHDTDMRKLVSDNEYISLAPLSNRGIVLSQKEGKYRKDAKMDKFIDESWKCKSSTSEIKII